MSKLIDNNKLLEIFYENPNKWYHIREISRIIKLSPTTASKYLNKLKKEGILDNKEERRHILFRANTEDKKFITKKINYNIDKIKNSGLITFLEEELIYPKAIILFGSYAKGENTPDSDIDIFVLTESKKKINLSDYEKNLKTEIQLFVHNNKEFQLMKKNNKEIFNNIINGIKLYGFIEVV